MISLDEIPNSKFRIPNQIRGVSSAGRAPALQAGGNRFDPGTLHHKKLTEVPTRVEASLSFLKEEFKDVPWKLNIVIIDAIYEKATVKENF